MGKRLTALFVSLGERAKVEEEEDAGAVEKAASKKRKSRDVREQEDAVRDDGVDEMEVMHVLSVPVFLHTHTNTHTQRRMYASICLYIRMYVCNNTYMCVCVCVCVYPNPKP